MPRLPSRNFEGGAVKEQSPAFSWYPKDYLSDFNVRRMSLAGRGAYLELLNMAWLEGSLPADPEALRAAVGASVEEWRDIWPTLAPCFVEAPGAPGRLVHPRLEVERQEQEERRERAARAGRASGEKRNTNKRGTDFKQKANETRTDGQREANGKPTRRQRNPNHPSPSPVQSTTPPPSERRTTKGGGGGEFLDEDSTGPPDMVDARPLFREAARRAQA